LKIDEESETYDFFYCEYARAREQHFYMYKVRRHFGGNAPWKWFSADDEREY